MESAVVHDEGDHKTRPGGVCVRADSGGGHTAHEEVGKCVVS